MKLRLTLPDAKINSPYFIDFPKAFTLSFRAVESPFSVTILVSP